MLRRLLRIQYASDLHLEHYDKVAFQPMLKPVAPLLALVGDLGHPERSTYRDLIQYCSRNWRHVFVIAGNHELYSSVKRPAEQLLAQCESIVSEFANVHFMNRRRVECEGVTFLGATLWTNLTGHEDIARRYMSDYRHIYNTDGRQVEPEDTTAWHLRDRNWIREQLESCKGPTVILTHHLPMRDLISEKYNDDPLNVCFATDCTEFVRPPVAAIICGHTHTARQVSWVAPDLTLVHGCVNPRGYPGEQDTGYSKERFVEVFTTEEEEDYRDPLLVASAIGYDNRS